MFMLEMVLDEFSYVAFMEQDTDFLSYELGSVTESGEISEVLKLYHVRTYICEVCFQTIYAFRLKIQVHVIYYS
jgi:hypothetical protein